MRKSWLCILPLTLLLLPDGAAAEKPQVKVSFMLAEPSYRDDLTDPQIRVLATDVTSFLVGELSREVRFLRFTGREAPFRLVVRLGIPRASKREFRDVFFYIELTRPDGVRRSTTWLYRAHTAWGTGIGSPTQFKAEIETRLGGHDMAELVPEVLSAIPVANDGFLVHDQKIGIGWVLPFRQEEMCMEAKSEVMLETQVASDLGILSREFRARASMAYDPPPGRSTRKELRHCLLCLAVPDQEGLDTIRQSQPSDVRVTQVFVMSYRRMQSCQEPLPPAAAAASFGSGR
jgi:hypothetical protein